jgi:lipoprotein-anchoring transpeptidase ErfK/SrfK
MNTYSHRARIGFPPRNRSARAPILIGGLIAVIVLALLGLYAYDRGNADVIAGGVRINGLDVGGLSRAAATKRVEASLVAPLGRTITIRFRGRSWQINGGQASVKANANATVSQAISISREGSFVSRGLRDLFGGGLNRDIPLRVSLSQQVVRSLAARVAAAVNRPAQDAQVKPTGAGLGTLPARKGVKVRSNVLSARIARALTHALLPATVAVPIVILHPRVTARQLAGHYPAYILVDRAAFTLRFYKHLQLTNSYPIAVGMQGLETPGGLYHIQWKQVDPPWYVPNDSWAGSLAGQVIPPGPQDPLKARFLSFDGGAGIHGIDPSEYDTIGHQASHGCIRMTIPDVIDLYRKSPVGTPVYIL